ncbi:hypothetical protein NDU88_001237 [Pleurodeles waltl]|uniref:Gypsy retrotransposon integrase-like protein 1 n=1 Tax=Pleurodeles waltl TaxID=8319 RepID=A0AAV7Q3Q1_PLEWA|nr:hypothetical protein NDU88_001237 [Pleurodeles waltl]
MLEARHLYTRDNKTNLVIRVIAGALGFTYVTFNEGDTVPIAYKSHLYSNAEKRFAPTEKILTAVQMAVTKERPLDQGKRIIVVSPVPALEAVTEANVPNAKALHPRWIEWATSLTATDVDYVFDPRLQTQEFLQYEQEYPAPIHILPIDSYDTIIYTDGSAQPAVGTKHQYSAACAAVCGTMEDGVFHPHNTYTQTLGDCTAQLAELKALLLALEHLEPGTLTLIVCDSYYCVQSYNEYLNHWKLNEFRDSKGNTIKHKMLWGRVADLKDRLPCAAKATVATASVAAVTRSRTRLDNEILLAVKASAAGKTLPKGYPANYTYHISAQNVAFATIPDVGDRVIPNEDQRLELITAAHEGVASAHAGIQATITILQQRYWWPGLCRRTKQYVLCCDIYQQIKGSNIKRPPQTSLLVSDKPLHCVYLDHCGPLQPNGAYKYILVAVDSCSRFLWVWPQRSADARTVIKDLLIFIGTYAVAAFLSDQGPAFASKAFRDTMGTMGVELHYSSPYHPEGNSVVERRNRDLKQSLTARVLGSGRSWLHHLYGVQRALNNLPRRSLGGKSPYEVLFGTPMYVPDLDAPGMVAAETPFDIKERLAVLQELQQFRDDKSSATAAILGIRDLAKTSTGWIPNVGDLVREKIAVKKEFGPSYRAPVPVLGIKGTRTVILPPLSGSKSNRFISIDDIKLHHVANSSQ